MNARALFVAMFASIVLVLSSACSGESKLGEECDESGADGECESGSVCGKNTGEALICLKACSQQSDCTADQECNGVEGSSATGCRLKSGAGTV
jgi:hypothetical protein